MTRALDVMQPNDDHHIVIEGIQPDTRTLRDLETRFNLTLEASLGSTLGLHYSQRSKGFVFERTTDTNPGHGWLHLAAKD